MDVLISLWIYVIIHLQIITYVVFLEGNGIKRDKEVV